MNILIWKRGKVTVTLTTESSASHYGFPVLRVQHPSGNADLGPADLAPAAEDEPSGTAAALLLTIHANRPLKGKALEAARRFLSQWPDGPQLTPPPTTLIPRQEIGRIAEAVRALVNEHGHPDDIPLGALAERGINPETAEKCEALLTSEDMPEDPALAVAKWMRMIGEFSVKQP